MVSRNTYPYKCSCYNRSIMKLCSAVVIATLCLPVFAADIGVVEEIIAKVNGDIITRTEMDRARRQIEADLKQRGTTGPALEQELAKREKFVLSERIDQLLLVQKGKELNINVDPDVTKFIAGLQLEAKIADPEKFQQ